MSVRISELAASARVIKLAKLEREIAETISNGDDPWEVPRRRRRFVGAAIRRLRLKGIIRDNNTGDPAEPDYYMTDLGTQLLYRDINVRLA
jgi:hypothetical protein